MGQDGKKLLMSVKNLSHTYDKSVSGPDVEALTDVDLDIYEGDFICVLGPSGCGKSSLLNILSGLMRATGGTVLMNGRRVSGVDADRAVVFQTPTLYPWLTVEKNVAFGPDIRGLSSDETKERVSHYLELVGLTEFAQVRPYELSGGMRQRAALARALVNEPKMIFLDEPFGALDAFTRESMQVLLREIWRESKPTIFLITHDVDEALMLGSRLVIMSERPGRIVVDKEIDFTVRVSSGEEDVRYSAEYIRMRKDALSAVGQGK